MKKGILGRKLGMTQVFTNSGLLIPVTVIKVEPNVITQIKTQENDGYEAIQLGLEDKKEKLSNKPIMGHTKKANTEPKRFFREIRGINVSDYTLGQALKADVFEIGEMVDVTGISKGHGFQGAIKRHNYHRGPMSHGSRYHRRTGSLGSMRPKRVFKGTKLPGHMGVDRVTIQNLEVVAIDLENNVILIKGSVPGPKKSLVIIKTAVKNENVIKKVEALVSYEEAKVVNDVKDAVETNETSNN